MVLDSIGRFCSNLPGAVIAREVLGPPDVETPARASPAARSSRASACRSTCGSNRLEYRTPMPGVYLCGACTHPGGSVIGINGRNAAYEVLGLLD